MTPYISSSNISSSELIYTVRSKNSGYHGEQGSAWNDT